MSGASQECPNCGALMELSADGQHARCRYCGASQLRAVDPALLAEALRAEAASGEQLLESLARRLGPAFPQMVRVETSGGFLSARKVTAFELWLESAAFRLERAPRGVAATRADVVRGIVLKKTQLGLDQWIRALCEALSAVAGASALVQQALTGIVPDRPRGR